MGTHTWSELTTKGCFHVDAEAVVTVDGEHVGYVCPDCDRVLPAAWSTFADLRAAEQFVVLSLIQCGYSPYDVREMVLSKRGTVPPMPRET